MDIARLKSVPLFADVPDDELRTIAPFAAETAVEAGRELVKEGQYSYEFMAIEEGEAEVVRNGEHVARLGPGEFFGEIGVLERTLRTASVVATTPMRLLTLSQWDLKRVGGAIDEIRATLEQRQARGAQGT